MIIVVHVCILFPNLDALQMTGLWAEGSSSPLDCCHICMVFILFLKMVESLLGMLKEPLKVMRAVKYAQANMNMLGPIFTKLSLHA